MKLIYSLLVDKRGASSVEYAFVLVMISLGLISASQGIGDQLSSTFSTASQGFTPP